MIFVQFTDDTHMKIQGSFSNPQPALPNMGTVSTWDLRWKIWVENSPFPAQEQPTEKWEHQYTSPSPLD